MQVRGAIHVSWIVEVAGRGVLVILIAIRNDERRPASAALILGSSSWAQRNSGDGRFGEVGNPHGVGCGEESYWRCADRDGFPDDLEGAGVEFPELARSAAGRVVSVGEHPDGVLGNCDPDGLRDGDWPGDGREVWAVDGPSVDPHCDCFGPVRACRPAGTDKPEASVTGGHQLEPLVGAWKAKGCSEVPPSVVGDHEAVAP